jgi:DTW domain-containing protein YfiP
MTQRPTCPRCRLPERTCLCGLVAPVANAIDVLVLQHPDEVREAKGSVRLMALSLARCRVLVGEVFDEASLHELLHGDGRASVLLYPENGSRVDTSTAAARGDGALGPSRLVVIDGTWRKSVRMLKSNPLLEALPRHSLRPERGTRYAALRKARRPGQLSTLEAVCAALGALEDAPGRYRPLLQAFDRFVATSASRRPGWATGP